MSILNTHIHKLRLYIHKDAPSEYKIRWDEFKAHCENGDEHKNIAEQIKNYCKSQINKDLPYLKREEGGLGGDNNLRNKQIRFRTYFSMNDYRDRDDDIILHEIVSTKYENWTYDELDDLLRAFIKTANYNINSTYDYVSYVNGCIDIFNKNMLCDSYLESDSDSE